MVSKRIAVVQVSQLGNSRRSGGQRIFTCSLDTVEQHIRSTGRSRASLTAA